MELTVVGKMLTAMTGEARRAIITEISTKLSESARNALVMAFERSMEIQAYAGQSPDIEVRRVILRSIKVKVSQDWPPVIEASFDDDLKHWYDGEIPDDLAAILQKVIDEALEIWLRSPEATRALVDVIGM